jgi:hypothetical protein
MILYLIAVIPAAWFQNLGNVLAASGAVGGSCLAYIGPGAVYLGVHGARFLEISKVFFGHGLVTAETPPDEEMAPLYSANVSGDLPELGDDDENFLIKQLKAILWYLLFMPVWTAIANYGKTTLTDHVHDLAMKSPHPIRIGNVRFASTRVSGGTTRVLMLPQKGASQKDQMLAAPTNTTIIRTDSLPNTYGAAQGTAGLVLALPRSPHRNAGLPAEAVRSSSNTQGYQSINQKIGTMAKRKQQEEALALEDDPQQDLPGKLDFLVAVFYIIFGFVAMIAGLVSLFLAQT